METSSTKATLVSASAKDAIFDVLVEHAGAWEADRDGFFRRWPECSEFRFQGDLGFGGKVWYSYGDGGRGPYAYVSAYPEDMTDERRAIVDRVNKMLEALTL